MTDTVITFRDPEWTNHPLIASALAAVERAQMVRMIRASSHVASRVHMPRHMVSLDGEQFFPTSSLGVADRVYRKATHYLEMLMRDESFLS